MRRPAHFVVWRKSSAFGQPRSISALSSLARFWAPCCWKGRWFNVLLLFLFEVYRFTLVGSRPQPLLLKGARLTSRFLLNLFNFWIKTNNNRCDKIDCLKCGVFCVIQASLWARHKYPFLEMSRDNGVDTRHTVSGLAQQEFEISVIHRWES